MFFHHNISTKKANLPTGKLAFLYRDNPPHHNLDCVRQLADTRTKI